MTYRIGCTFTALMALVAGPAFAALGVPSGAYVLENTHGYITFSYSHMGFSHPQVAFNSFTVDVQLNADDPTKSEVKVSIDPNSIDSRVPDLDKYLTSEKSFNTAAHPSIGFESTAITMTSATKARIDGNLTIKGISKPVTLDTRLNKAAVHPMRKVPVLGLDATTTVKRSEFGLGEYVPMVGDDVTITISVELMKQP
jgi:polyisoprenoid-binding protein YceI